MREHSNVRLSTHPLAAVALARLRDATTAPPAFRTALNQIGGLLVAEATSDLPLATTTVATPLATAPAAHLAAPVAFFPVLRAGLGLLPAAQALLPDAPVWHVGLYRDEATCRPSIPAPRATLSIRCWRPAARRWRLSACCARGARG
jgi:uracil phosphoribosyltransferase